MNKIKYDAEERTRERYQSQHYAKQYKKEYVSDLSFKGIRSRIIANREIKVIKNILDGYVNDGMTVMDLPCGTGKLGPILSNYPIKIVAGDISKEMLSLAKNEYKVNKVEYKVIDATNITYGDGSIDVIICLRLFQRLDKETRKKILHEFSRVGDGVLIVSYSHTSLWQKIRTFIRNLIMKNINIFFSVSMKIIEDELTKAGFKVLYTKSVLPIISSEIVVYAQCPNR